MKHNVMATANAAAITIGFIYVVCSLLLVIAPAFFKSVADSWFHVWNLDALWTGAPRGSFILGLISAMVGSWFVGYIFAWTYNRFVK